MSARNLAPAGSGGSGGLDGGAQTSKGALTVQKARMLHGYTMQWLGWNSSCKWKENVSN